MILNIKSRQLSTEIVKILIGTTPSGIPDSKNPPILYLSGNINKILTFPPNFQDFYDIRRMLCGVTVQHLLPRMKDLPPYYYGLYGRNNYIEVYVKRILAGNPLMFLKYEPEVLRRLVQRLPHHDHRLIHISDGHDVIQYNSRFTSVGIAFPKAFLADPV